MNAIEINNITVSIRHKQVLQGIDLTIPKGEFMTFLGPSGCGKTTLLRTIAGLQRAESGSLRIGGKEAANGETGLHVEAARRGVSLVFQSYALWPHMTVFENVAFGLQVQKLPKAEIKTRVQNALAKMRISELGDRYPGQLSGGQQQRVAIARAIVTEPEILLLDEPLSNLDAKLRIEMRAELKRLHHELHTTIVYVTHDQQEAMTMSTQVAVFFGGRIVQVDKPRKLYGQPRTLEVAEFIGNAGNGMNFIEGTFAGVSGKTCLQTAIGTFGIEGLAAGEGEFVVTVKPEDIRLSDKKEPGSLQVEVEAVFPSGAETLLQLRVGEGQTLMARMMGETDYEAGNKLYAALRPERINVYEKRTGKRLDVPIIFIQQLEELQNENRFSYSR